MAQAAALETSRNRQYRSDGYAIVRQALPSGLIADAGRHLDAMIARLAPGERPEGLVEPHVNAPDWQFWLELCRTPAVVDSVADCLGADEVLLIMSHLIVKPAGDGLAVAWHQDNTYWPSVTGTDVLTVWLALNEVDIENACMHVIPRSHAGYPEMEKIATDGKDLLKVRVHTTPEMEASAVPVELHPGQYSLHDSYIIHGSGENRSARRRDGYTMRYADAATVQVELDRHWVPVYYLRGDGTSLKPGMRDLRPGRPLPTEAKKERPGPSPLR
jgi:ectoine hydroxylase-related dioxygenase (phytanoyl-CoA dioxygenase family)